MTPADLQVVQGWAADEGWNPGRDDAGFFMIPDPAGLMVVTDDAGDVIGSIGMPRFGDDFAFAGLYIVRPDHRGGQTGARLARAALAHAGDRMVGTDGVLERVAAYEGLGFTAVHSHHRHSGCPDGAEHPQVRPPTAADMSALVDIDDVCFPGERRAFMAAWLGDPHVCRAWIADDGAPAGFGVARQAVDGWRIGPLLAPDAVAAGAIVRSLAAALSGEVLHLDMNTGNPEAADLARDLGMAPGFECVRMYRGGIPDLPIRRMWGCCTLELG